MRECHLKMICNDRGDARREWILTPDAVFVIKEGFEVHSALYGDGKSRYTDVTKTVRGWTEDALWPENWEELLYATRKPRAIGINNRPADSGNSLTVDTGSSGSALSDLSSLVIHSARYGVSDNDCIDVRERLQSLVSNNSLDIIVNNSTLTPNQNPFRGQKKHLRLDYSMDGGGVITRRVEEKDWLIIGPAAKWPNAVDTSVHANRVRFQDRQSEPVVRDLGGLQSAELIRDREGKATAVARELPQGGTVIEPVEVTDGVNSLAAQSSEKYQLPPQSRLKDPAAGPLITSPSQLPPMTTSALNDYLIRKFSISPQRLRGPMPIELRDFHRNDLAQLFAELGFKRGAEIGVAEGNYSEVLLKANLECELLLVDPWHHYSENPQGKSKEKHEYAYNETLRKTAPYRNAQVLQAYSMDAVRNIEDDSLDFVYIDGHHSYPYVMCDIIEWTKKVRSGGIVAGDDVYRLDEVRWGAGPMEAIYDYTRAMRINPWWLISAHKSVDFFFVKP